MILLYWVLGLAGYLVVGEAVAAFSAVLLPTSLLDARGGFAWYWASLRVLLWPAVILFVFFFALSIPVRFVHQRVRVKAEVLPAAPRRVA